ncbi:MAG TPA: HDOD domain-containing protein [Spongiibacteraceae bacterium]|nr:HDOD domain-containing protein [Spongiibacteraceae bacterium]
MSSNILLARQAIYDRELRVYAYELLFRSQATDMAHFTDGDHATSSVLLNAFTALPVDDILEGKPAFVNFTRNLLDSPPPIDASRLVVEILENIVIDAATIEAIRRLKQQGYTIALDDYIYIDGHHELIELADLVKVDVLIQSMDSVRALLQRLKPYNVLLLAEKVETQEMYEACKQLGFHYFQGYFLSRPQIVKGRTLQSNQRTVLQLLTTLKSDEVEFSQIEQVIQTDSVLALKILRLVNSAFFNQQREIKSIRQALALLGLEKIRSWAQLLALSNLDDKPAALFTAAMVRARFAQLLAERATSGDLHAESQFTVGLLSTLDAFLGMEMEDVLKSIAVSDNMRDAILQRQGDSGFLLAVTIAFERADWDAIDWPRLQTLGIDSEAAQQAYVQSLQWADENLQFLR